METNRQRFYKKKIKCLTSGSSEQQSKALASEVRDNSKKNKRHKIKSPNSSDTEVTILGSTSYLNQNKDLGILMAQISTIKTNKENLQHCQNELDDENIRKQTLPQIFQEEEKNTNFYTIKETGLPDVQSQINKDIPKMIDLAINSEKKPNEEPQTELQIHRNYDGTLARKDVNIIIEIEPIESESEHEKETTPKIHPNAEEGIKVKINNRDTQKEVLLSITENENNLNDIFDLSRKEPISTDKITMNTSPKHIAEKENKFEMSEDLQPTITKMIPETDMDLIRKSLENDDLVDNNIDIPSSPDEEAENENKKRERININQSYVDFLSEDDDFVWDSSSWKDTGASSSSEDDQPKKKKIKKRLHEEKVGEDGVRKKKINNRKQKRAARERGKEYVKKDGSITCEKQLHPNPCTEKNCGHKCREISEIKRKNLFDHFWSLSAERKKNWLVAMSTKKEIIRKRNKDSSYRTNTFCYYINDGEGRRQVCLQFLLKTLDVSQRYVYYTLSNASFDLGSAKNDARGKTVPINKTPDAVKNSAVNFLKSLPALPSHYCRKDSTRLYLPTEYRNIKNLYRMYKEDRVSQGVDVINEKLFRNIFNKEFNLGFHVPKKDKCLKCLKYEGKEKTEPEIESHLKEKEASKRRLEVQRDLGKKNPSILCTSFDLQKVLNTPHGNSMLLFYSRKYAVYNLCFYESVTRNGFCFVWGETEGKRGGNEIATILQKYIMEVDQRKSVKTLILYSDSCPGQNKNKIVLAAVHNALLMSDNLETIQMNYLLPGHTEMTVDSVHSTIESSVRNTTVWAPSQWMMVCQLARKEPKPYQVESLSHDEFKNFEELSEKYFKGNLQGKISKIRVATFKKSAPNVMTLKYSMSNDAAEEIIPIISKPKTLSVKYKSRLPITKTKYNDLKKLCDSNVIPRVFHAEYLNFPTCNGKDVLIDTDIEDNL